MLFLDHAILFVRRLGHAENAFRRLGFTISARGCHERLGTANHTIMLERTYFELLSVIVPTEGNVRWARILDRREGFGGIALGTRDARATRSALASRGVTVGDPIDFGRQVALPDGSVEARFTIAHLLPEASPVLPAFLCQHHTPELVWRPELRIHPNTAFRLAGMTVAHPDPDSVSARYEQLLGRASVHPHPGGIALDLLGTRLWLVRPEYAAERLDMTIAAEADGTPLGLTISVHHLDATRRLLADHGVPHRPFGARSILVPPSEACGVHLEFLAA